MVREVKANGALRVAPVGGLQANNTETETVHVYTRAGKVLEGTLQLENASVHVNGEYSKTQRTFDTLELLLDAKTHSAAETRALGVDVGDYVAVEPRFNVTETGSVSYTHLLRVFADSAVFKLQMERVIRHAAGCETAPGEHAVQRLSLIHI